MITTMHIKPVVIYTWEKCGWCKKAKDLLNKKGIEYEEREITNENNYNEISEYLNAQGISKVTVPQIFIGDEHIGGYSDLEKLNAENKLDKMLQDYSFYTADIYENDMGQPDELDIELHTNYDDIL
ncbi:glutaredoxin domain-containing protein [Candidatus Mesenet endosymbiont of Agriotes lineatus]|uniref:glutaredoxin domain-containing protein n=1 Tax=Candidatus Mesenet endosymbiont of Agriotes lineatus TaxID=3077948 RepID=UPI0030D4D615